MSWLWRAVRSLGRALTDTNRFNEQVACDDRTSRDSSQHPAAQELKSLQKLKEGYVQELESLEKVLGGRFLHKCCIIAPLVQALALKKLIQQTWAPGAKVPTATHDDTQGGPILSPEVGVAQLF